ncbi:putative glyoxalase/bleomycin resistance protein [Tersicoccus solisilvae]|uniref:Glyoxalase/bleomycin resistance protein n=1 Tax=Tersicoccus solisilvae TaxID=1882339 RepID=A0ABQ1NRS4_9MICC|nr:VOC family protein [Tersicoccus solisilvae]GGC82235.1 putative glyoxalase/bleomycin resistance protein [Tersicoccus solisilvae]
MTITISSSFLPHTEPEASLAFYRDVLGFEIRLDVGQGEYRWLTVGPAGQPDTAIVLTPPAVQPGLTDEEKQTILDIMAKGSFFGVNLTSTDLDATFADLEAKGADVIQEPTDQPWGARDCAIRDPAGNMIRIAQAG